MATLDSSIVNIALPTLTREFSTELSQVKWVVIIYLFIITCLLLPFGRISDQYGRKLIFQSGLLIFTIGSVLCGLSPTLFLLVMARALQAVGAAMLMANGPAVITSAFPSSERGAALGVMAMVVSAGLISGPSLGGLLITHFGWRTIFWVNVPVGLIGISMVYRFFSRDSTARTPMQFDWAGAILQTLLLISFILLFDPPRISISGSAPFPLPRWGVGVVTLTLAFLFFSVERQASSPLFDLSLLKNRTFRSANLASFFMFVSFSAVSVLMPFFLQEVAHLTPRHVGLMMTAIPFTVFVIAPISGRLSDQLGSRDLSVAGAMVAAISLFAMAGIIGNGIHEDSQPVFIVIALCAVGLATGLFQSPNNNAIMGAVPTAKLSVASALLATIRNLGFVTGTGLSTALFTWRLQATEDFTSALHTTFFAAGFVAIGAVIASYGKRKR